MHDIQKPSRTLCLEIALTSIQGQVTVRALRVCVFIPNLMPQEEFDILTRSAPKDLRTIHDMCAANLLGRGAMTLDNNRLVTLVAVMK